MKPATPLLLGALACGALIRAFSGAPLLQTDLAEARLPAAAALPAGGAEAAVLAFYESLGKGDYARAWELSLEPAWPGISTARYGDEVRASAGRPAWTTKEIFVRRCGDDIGERVKLNGLAVDELPAPPSLEGGLAAAALAKGSLHGVRASGQMLGACLIYRWNRDLAVVEERGRYRVVLPGTKAARAFPHQSWFSDITLVGSLRLGIP